MKYDETPIDLDAALLPLQAQQQDADLVSEFVAVPGQLRSLDGQTGPDIDFATAANSVVVSSAGNIITFGLASTIGVTTVNATTVNATNFDASGEYRVDGTKVVGNRDTGWTAATGTAHKGAHAVYAGQTVSAGYVAAEAQQTDDALKANSQRLKAIEDCLRAHGLIN